MRAGNCGACRFSTRHRDDVRSSLAKWHVLGEWHKLNLTWNWKMPPWCFGPSSCAPNILSSGTPLLCLSPDSCWYVQALRDSTCASTAWYDCRAHRQVHYVYSLPRSMWGAASCKVCACGHQQQCMTAPAGRQLQAQCAGSACSVTAHIHTTHRLAQ